MKEVDGCHWVARPQPLPALEVKRPEVLHESVDGEEDAADATIELCEENKEIGNPLRFCESCGFHQDVSLTSSKSGVCRTLNLEGLLMLKCIHGGA